MPLMQQTAAQRAHSTPGGTLISRVWPPEHIDRVIQLETELGRAVCGARTTSRMDEDGIKPPCKQTPGFGTEHPGEGRCKFHGGSSPARHGRSSVLRHYDISDRINRFWESKELMDVGSAVATAWAAMDAMLEEDAVITPDRAVEIVAAMGRISTMIKQHHDITEGQKISIEVPQFMEWSEHLYELAVKYLVASEGDVRGFLAEAQQYYSGAIAIVTGDSPPAIGDGGSDEVEVLL